MHRCTPFLLALVLVFGCDEERDPGDGGTTPDGSTMADSGGGADTGPAPDAGPTPDASPPADAGPTPDSGPETDGGGPDASPPSDSGPADAGCVPDECPAGACGMLSDGCGSTIDCGGCGDGEPCNTDADCDGGTCFTEPGTGFPGGMCTRRCADDTGCDVSDHCARIDPISRLGFCRADCVSDTDCRDGYTCADTDEAPGLIPDDEDECTATAVGSGAVGDACGSIADCAGGLGGFCLLEPDQFRGGYCTLPCTTGPDSCPSGNHCSVTDTDTGAGFCVANCDADSECRGGADGYLCYDGDAQGTDECYPAGTGASAIGGACEGVWDCAGGPDARCFNGFQDGYCVEVGCTVDTDCGAGAHCGTHTFGDTDFNLCTPDCTPGTTTCRDGQLCLDTNDDAQLECWVAGTGSSPVGGPCAATYDCSGAERARCIPENSGQFADGYCVMDDCTAGGTGSESCPSGSRCQVAMGETVGVCVDACTVSGDCRSDGYDCFDGDDIGTETECLPAATGAGLVGSACTERTDCGGGRNGTCLIGETFLGGYCTVDCTTESCPGDSVCATVSTFRLCLDACTMDTQCREPLYGCGNSDAPGDPDSCIPGA